MKKLVLLALAASLAIFGCATADKITKDLNQATVAIDQAATAASQTIAAAATAANTTLNAVDRVQTAAERVSEDAQNLKNRAILSTQYTRYRVVKGDTLWAISRRQYKTGFLWPFLCEQNGLANCHRIKVGDSLRYASPELMATYSVDELSKYRLTAFRSK